MGKKSKDHKNDHIGFYEQTLNRADVGKCPFLFDWFNNNLEYILTAPPSYRYKT